MRRTSLRTLGVLLLPLALLGCGKRTEDRNLDTLDNELVEAGGNASNASDPALTAALHDQIMVDPTLTQHANTDSVRPPTQPGSGGVPPVGIAQGGGVTATGPLKATPAPGKSCPGCTAARESLTLGALASRQSDRRTSGCAGAMRYSASWANRLPADVPLYPSARITEAAGADTADCALRAVSFSTNARLQSVLDYYYTRLTANGFSAEHQSDGNKHTLGGTRARDDGAYVVFLSTRRDGGTDVDLIANNGR